MNDQKVWYVSSGGQQVGPVSADDIANMVASNEAGPGSYVFGPGASDWTPLSRVPQLAHLAGAPPAPPSHGPPMTAMDIDYEIGGAEMQYVEITLDPGEACVAEAGSFFYMDQGVEMETIFGDGSNQDSGFLGKLKGLGKRLMTGESLFMTVFGNTAGDRRRVSFAAPYPGKIVAVDLRNHGNQLLCQKDSFLCAAKGVSVGIGFSKKLGAGLFGGEGFILQKLEGDGLAFVHAGGSIVARDLSPGETVKLDTGCLVAFEATVIYDIQFVGGIKNALFGGEGVVFATLTGPGRVWLQSLPFSRMAGRIVAEAVKAMSGSGQGEGSILGGIGMGS